jgi:hypothetical protein
MLALLEFYAGDNYEGDLVREHEVQTGRTPTSLARQCDPRILGPDRSDDRGWRLRRFEPTH